MKKLRNLIMLMIVFVLLGGGYLYARSRPQEDMEPAVQQPVERHVILDLGINDISKIEVSSSRGRLSLEKKSGEWSMSGNSYQLDKSVVFGMLDTIISLRGEKIVEENPEDLDKYGLKTPQASGRIILNSGEEHLIYLGNKTPAGDSFYLMKKGIDKVYTVSMESGFAFLLQVSDLRDRTVQTINPAEIMYAKILQKDKPEIELQYNEGQSSDDLAFGVNTWKMLKPYSYEAYVDLGRLEALAANLQTFRIADFVDEQPKDLSQYGLDKPLSDIVLRDKTRTFHIQFGKDKNDSKVYFKLADKEGVYTVEKKIAESFALNAFDIVQKFVYLTNPSNVNKLIIESKNSKDELELTKGVMKASKAGEKDETVITYRLNGKEIKSEEGKKFYQTVVGLAFDGENKSALEEKAEVKTIFILDKGDKKENSISYVPFDSDFYGVFKEGKSHFLISRNQIKEMLRQLEELKK